MYIFSCECVRRSTDQGQGYSISTYSWNTPRISKIYVYLSKIKTEESSEGLECSTFRIFVCAIWPFELGNMELAVCQLHRLNSMIFNGETIRSDRIHSMVE